MWIYLQSSFQLTIIFDFVSYVEILSTSHSNIFDRQDIKMFQIKWEAFCTCDDSHTEQIHGKSSS